MRPAPATQPWPESVNWTAASAGDWPDPEPDPEAGEAVAVASAAVPVPAQDEDGAGGTAAGGELGVDPVPADAREAVPADPDDAAAQPATGPATASTASTASAEAAAGRARSARDGGAGGSNVWFARALKGISFVTFQMTLYPLARLYRVPSVWSWGELEVCWPGNYASY
jgi:hypothetical protein